MYVEFLAFPVNPARPVNIKVLLTLIRLQRYEAPYRNQALAPIQDVTCMKVSSAVFSLKAKLGGETSIVAGTVITQNVLRLVGSVIMTRLLSAEAFGVVGIITSVIVTFGLISDIGITAFIIRHRGADDRDFINELWTLRLIRSIILTVVVILASYPIAHFLGKPELQYAIALGSLTFVVDGLDSLGAILALKGRQQKRLSQLDILSQLLNMAFTIILAVIFRNFWAILLGNLAGQTLRACLSYYLFPGIRHRWRFSRDRASEMWKFSRFITGSTILTLIISQTDKVVLAKVFSLEMFGLYIVAAGLAMVPTGVATAYTARILLPRYAEVARHCPEDLREAYYSQRIKVHLLYAGAVGLLAGCAPFTIETLYDSRYQEAAFYFQILLLGSFFTFGNIAANDVMIAKGNSFFTLANNIVRLSFLSVVGCLAYHQYGPLGLIVTVATIELAAQIYAWVMLYKHSLLTFTKELAIIGVGVTAFVIGIWVNSFMYVLARMAGLISGSE